MTPTPDQPTALRWAYRAVGLYRAGSAVGAVVALLVANAIPIVGVAFFGWSLMTILVLYWLENGIVGLWNLPRIALAEGPPTGIGRMATLNGRAVTSMSTAAQRAFTIPFFLVHYGIFWVVHGIFVFALPLFLGFADVVPRGIVFEPGAVSVEGPPFADPGAGRGFGTVEMGPLVLGAIALFVSHGVSFFWNYLGQGEYRRTSPVAQMFAPYGRLVVLHLTIVLGAWPVVVLGSPIGLLLVLVVGKMVLDLAFHLREHAKAAATPPAA
jgi:hypothetical protein